MRKIILFAAIIVLTASFQTYGDMIGNVVNNPSMEGNFNNGVADGWTTWGGGGSFYNETSYAHDGSKSQGWFDSAWSGDISWDAGIYQQLSSLESGKVYDTSAWFQYQFGAHPGGPGPWQWMAGYPSGYCSTTFSIGIDTSGGTDPTAVTEWKNTSYDAAGESYCSPWINVATSFTADSDTATIFIKLNGHAMAMAEYYMYDPMDPYMPQPPPTQMGPANIGVELNIDDVFVPEPATLLLLSLGGLILRRKHRA
jgi:hypothetical protein